MLFILFLKKESSFKEQPIEKCTIPLQRFNKAIDCINLKAKKMKN